MQPPRLLLGLPDDLRREVELAQAETRRRSKILQRLRQMEQNLPTPWHRVRRYNQWRSDLLKRRLAEAGQSFCTLCRNVEELPSLNEVLIAGRRLDNFELVSTKNRAVRYYVELHRLCQGCFDGAVQAGGSRRSAGGSQELNGCWRVCQDKGKWFYDDDGWWPVPPQAKPVPVITPSHLTMPSHKVVSIEKQWQVPAELFFDLNFGLYTCDAQGRPVLLV